MLRARTKDLDKVLLSIGVNGSSTLEPLRWSPVLELGIRAAGLPQQMVL